MLGRVKRQLARFKRLVTGKAGQSQPDRRLVEDLKRKLYTDGFLERAHADLQAVLSSHPSEALRREAAWELAVWHADQQTVDDAERCLALLPTAAGENCNRAKSQRMAVLKAECLELIGNRQDAEAVLLAELEMQRTGDLLLGCMNLATGEERVRWLNEVFAHYGLCPVAGSRDPRLSMLRSAHPGRRAGDKGLPCVTVIVPAYNCEDAIGGALDSLLAQTWHQLEILVVDDCSTDRSAEAIQQYAARDGRIRLIQSPVNQGPYVSQNMALQRATGDYVTCHGSDDWAHPEKLEKQVVHLLRNPSLVGNVSELVRMDDQLRCLRRGHPGYYIHSNMSLMFRRGPVMDRIGYWDSVRFSGDGEFFRRMKRAFGDDKVGRVKSGPLLLARQSNGSLTGDRKFGYPGHLMGARKEYFDAVSTYLDKGEILRVEFPQTHRTFAVPEPMRPVRESAAGTVRHFDVVLASDFRFRAGSTLSNLQEIRAQKAAGLRTGLIQMNAYPLPERPVSEGVRAEIDGGLVQMLVYGEEVECDLLIVRYPPVLQEYQQYIPAVRAREIRVIVNQPPMRDYAGGRDRVYDLGRCQSNLIRHFGKPGVWSPIGPLAREAVLREERVHEVIKLSADDWLNIIDVGEWYTGVSRCTGSKPVIGRHSRDQSVKWPDNARDLLDAYPEDDRFSVKILGGARTAQEVLGRTPKNWEVFAFNALDPKQFLSGIDFFVYFHHKGWVEAFGRAPMEAMAAGLPVILPESFKPLFKEAAIYAEPREVQGIVMELYRHPERYQERAELSRRFIEDNFGYSLHFKRIAAYVRKLQTGAREGVTPGNLG